MTNAANRVLWTVVGLVLAAAGAAGVLASFDYLPGTDADAPLLSPALRERWREVEPWGLWGIGLLGLVLAVLGLILLIAELRRPGGPVLGELHLLPDRPGDTRVRGRVVRHGLERDLARDREIRTAAVTVTGAAPRPDLSIRLDLEPRADLATVRDYVTGALDRFSRTYGLQPRRLEVTARVAGPAPTARVQ